jgi:anti-sigma B factor antagonist
MQVDKRMVDAVTVVSLTGDLDARTAPAAQQELSDIIPDGAPVLLDLSRVGYVSSAGLRMMLMAYRRAQQSGTTIALVGVPETLRTILSATGFLRFFEVAETIPEAISALES